MLLERLLSLLEKTQSNFGQQRVFWRFVIYGLGLFLTLGRRTIARVLASLGRGQNDWSADYRLFSRRSWSRSDLFAPIIQEALAYFPKQEPIVMAADFTHLKKSGKHIPKVTCMRDPMSPPFHVNLIWGLRFFQVTLLCPFRRHRPKPLPARSLPVCFESAPVLKKPGRKATKDELDAHRQALRQRPTAKAARECLEALRKQFDALGAAGRRLLMTLDGDFCNRVFFREALQGIDLVCRCRKDAVLCRRAEPEARPARFYARASFRPEEVRQDRQLPWKKTRCWLGGRWRWLRYKELAEVYWRSGAGRRPLRLLVLAPSPYRLHRQGRWLYRKPAYLLSDATDLSASALIAAYLDHWQIELNHREEKDTLGLGQAQVRHAESVPQQAAAVVALYGMLHLAALQAYGPTRTADYLPRAKWARRTARPSFQDLVALLRAQLLAHPPNSPPWRGSFSVLDPILNAAA